MISPSPANLLRGLALLGLAVAWALLAHFASAGDSHSDFSAAIGTAPIVALVVILLWRVGNPWWLVGGGLLVLGLLAWTWPSLRQNLAWLYYLQHLSTNLALAALFGRSLFGGGDSLVTGFARLARDGVISVTVQRYTRQVTLAWTVFFLANALLSTALFGLASPAAWSVFANLLATPLVVLMFVVEHFCRQIFLPPADRASVADTIRGYRASMQRRSATSGEQP